MSAGGPAAAALDQAYAACLALARAHYENFPVASRLLPRHLRPHVAAIYAFARTADDFADEPGRTSEERLHLLDAWRHCLISIRTGRGAPSHVPQLATNRVRGADLDGPPVEARPPLPEPVLPSTALGTSYGPPTGPAAFQVFLALDDTVRRFDLPVELFEDLLSAFAQDVTVTRYGTWAEVFDYCRRSANPVGRLILRLTRQATPQRDASADALCTALQLTNFWQDFAVDWSRGRLYVPEEEWQRHGASPATLDTGGFGPEWRRTLAAAVEVTREQFAQGRFVCDDVSGRLRWELRAIWLGGMRVLDAVARGGFNPVAARPTLATADKLAALAGLLRWRAGA